VIRAAEFAGKFEACAGRAGVTVTPSELDLLFSYYELLTNWNEAVNLTGLPLIGYPEQTLDRLFIQPLVAAQVFPQSEVEWLDIGSGGGSPAIPLKVVRPKARLTMTEPRQRKVAFLREVVRTLCLTDVEVVARRVEESHVLARSIDIVTVRAVRLDASLVKAASAYLNDQGRLLSFGADLAPFLLASEESVVRLHAASPVDLRGPSSQFTDPASNSRRFVQLFVYDCR